MSQIPQSNTPNSSSPAAVTITLPRSKEFSNKDLNFLGVYGFLGLKLLTFPLERMKILHQVDIIPEVLDEQGRFLLRESKSVFLERSAESQNRLIHYRGFFAKMLSYPAKEISVLMIAERVYRKIQCYSKYESPFKHSVYSFISSATTGALVELITYPLEVAKTRIICDVSPQSNRVFKGVHQSLFKKDIPISSMFNGLYISMVGAGIYRGIQLGLYETLLSLGLREQSSYIQLPVSVAVTMLAQTATYPLDSLRRLLMLKDTPFQISAVNTPTLARRMSHPSRIKDLKRGYSMQMYKSLTTGIFLFLYKSVSDNLEAVSF